jgi:hypothetical protein
VGIALITIVAIITTASVSLPAVYAKKHHHFTDTQKEDSTASDANGNSCTFGPSHDECANVLPVEKDQHIGTCEAVGNNNEAACDICDDHPSQSRPETNCNDD